MIANQLTVATMEHALTASMNTPVTVAQASPEPTVKQVVIFFSFFFKQM